jgi:hypothetical protein
MLELIKMLEQRNYWITKYLKANEAFVAILSHAPDMAVQELDFFYGNRESLLKIIGALDKKIRVLVDQIEKRHYFDDTAGKTKINFLLREKDSMVELIVTSDEQIIAGLEKLLKENSALLKKVTRGKKALANYKSNQKSNQKIDKQF